MPVVGIGVDSLMSRLGLKIAREELAEHLLRLGCSVEGFTTYRQFRCSQCGAILEVTETQDPPAVCAACGDDFRKSPDHLSEMGESEVLRMELLAVRPDIFDAGGLARMLRAYLGVETGLRQYRLAPPVLSVRVHPGMARPESHRPYIACAVVRNVKLDDELIKIVMRLQEDLHWAMGRDRKHASIGVYDLDTVSSGEFLYRPVGPEEMKFEPLGMPGRPMTPRGILEEHPKGRDFAKLLAGFAAYPLLTDPTGKVLSMPPIINSEATRVTMGSRNFFIDVTGTGQRIIGRTLNMLVTSLMELMPDITVEQVKVLYEKGERITPDLTPQEVFLHPAEAARLIGLDLTAGAVKELLGRMGHGVEDADGGRLKVRVPAYRNDVMHPWDLIEDVAIAYGLHNMTPSVSTTMTVGREQPASRWIDIARKTLVGLGLCEVITLPLTCPERAYDAVRLPRRDDHAAIDNPISVEQTMLRRSLLPGLLQTLSINTDHDLPQLIFEIGNVTVLDDSTPTGAREVPHLAAAAIGPQVGFETVRSILDSVAHELGSTIETAPDDTPTYIPGRAAKILMGPVKTPIGLLGEIHPEVLESHKLIYPVGTFEILLSAFF